MILDNGGDLFATYLDAPYDGLRGGTEETTSGRMRLEPLRDRLKLPVARLRAHLDGFSAPAREQAIASADVIITVTAPGTC